LGRGVGPTADAYVKGVRVAFPDHADEVLAVYSGKTPEEITASATALASDRFIAFSTWKWIDLHAQTGGKPTYRYFYSRPRPAMNPGKGSQGPAQGAAHSAEIEYAMANLAGSDVYAWTDDDRKVSDTMSGYFANFVKTGNPNGGKLPKWPAIGRAGRAEVMHIDVNTRVESEKTRPRYLLLDRIYSKQ
jgi:para-nitrobenzyl esterase